MKLKQGFIRHNVGGEHMAVATGEARKAFQGLVRNNATADALFELLMEETTEEQLVHTMCQRYDADPARIAADVHQMVERLRQLGFLQE